MYQYDELGNYAGASLLHRASFGYALKMNDNSHLSCYSLKNGSFLMNIAKYVTMARKNILLRGERESS